MRKINFKNPSGDHQRTNIIWEVQNNELNRQINVITTNTFNCWNYEIKMNYRNQKHFNNGRFWRAAITGKKQDSSGNDAWNI